MIKITWWCSKAKTEHSNVILNRAINFLKRQLETKCKIATLSANNGSTHILPAAIKKFIALISDLSFYNIRP